ncbi:MAG TPA: DUF6526 family protein [Gemmatimonadaceae bacterium]|nr:DUF6526 family protein [Gemmatimonadaceae bacterium]
MAEETQTFATHRRWIPAWHFFALPVLMINVFVVAMRTWRAPSLINGWAVLVAIALVTGIFISRSMPLRAQDRIIRLEERIRLERVLPGDMRGRIGNLTAEQFIGLRFAPDDEVPELTKRALNGELKTRADIKRAIRNWRPDHMRV